MNIFKRFLHSDKVDRILDRIMLPLSLTITIFMFVYHTIQIKEVQTITYVLIVSSILNILQGIAIIFLVNKKRIKCNKNLNNK